MRKVLMAVMVQSCFMMQSVAWAANKKSNSDNFLIVGCIIFLVVYFIPTFVGFSRNKYNKTAIFLLNFFLGWSLIGWVVALVWAVSKDKQPQTIIINNRTDVPPA